MFTRGKKKSTHSKFENSGAVTYIHENVLRLREFYFSHWWPFLPPLSLQTNPANPVYPVIKIAFDMIHRISRIFNVENRIFETIRARFMPKKSTLSRLLPYPGIVPNKSLRALRRGERKNQKRTLFADKIASSLRSSQWRIWLHPKYITWAKWMDKFFQSKASEFHPSARIRGKATNQCLFPKDTSWKLVLQYCRHPRFIRVNPWLITNCRISYLSIPSGSGDS